MVRTQTLAIRDFILSHVGSHPRDIARRVAREYGITRQAVNRHLQGLMEAGLVEAHGQTRAREYRLRPLVTSTRRLNVTPVLTEDRMWDACLRPHLEGVPHNVRELCQYAFTELAGNALAHSRATRLVVAVRTTAADVEFGVNDNGIGIFSALSERLGHSDARESVLELAKGRLTTDPDHHRGGSMLLVSRLFDRFELQSGDHTFTFTSPDDRWEIRREPFTIHGTSVRVRTSFAGDRWLDRTLDEWTTPEGEMTRAHLPVALMARPGEGLMSRAQAKQLTRRLDECSEVFLDFRGVETIGRGFADEVFRVFRASHPGTALVTMNACDAVRGRIREALRDAAPTAARTRDPHERTTRPTKESAPRGSSPRGAPDGDSSRENL
jgi:anti-sigma regulatory factor (Ser/Thr protein kinase)